VSDVAGDRLSRWNTFQVQSQAGDLLEGWRTSTETRLGALIPRSNVTRFDNLPHWLLDTSQSPFNLQKAKSSNESNERI